MQRGGTSETPAKNIPGAAPNQPRHNEEPTSTSASGSARKRRTVEVDALLEKRNLALSSTNSVYSPPREAVDIQPTASSTHTGRNGKKIRLMASDDFMRAIGLFRPDPPSVALRIPTEPQGQPTFSADEQEQPALQAQRPSTLSVTVPDRRMKRKRFRRGIGYMAPPGSPVSDDDEEATETSMVNGNEAERTSHDGTSNKASSSTKTKQLEEEKRSTSQIRVRIADAATQTDPVLVMSIEHENEDVALDGEFNDEPMEAFEADATPPALNVSDGYGIQEVPEQVVSIQSSSNVALSNGLSPGHAFNNERYNEDEDVVSDGELDNASNEAVVNSPPTLNANNGFEIVGIPEQCDSIQSTFNDRRIIRNYSNNEGVNDNEGVAANGEIDNNAVEAVATQALLPIVGNGQRIVENPDADVAIGNNEQIEQYHRVDGNDEVAAVLQGPQTDNGFENLEDRYNGIQDQEPANPDYFEFMEEDQEEDHNVGDVLQYRERQMEDIRRANVPIRRNVRQAPFNVHNAQIEPANLNEAPPRQPTPEVITIYDDIDGIFEVTLDSDGEEVEERILPNSARVQIDFVDDEEMRNVPAQMDAIRVREEDRILYDQPAPGVGAELVQQTAEHPTPEVQPREVVEPVQRPAEYREPELQHRPELHRQAQTDSESPGLPEINRDPNRAYHPEPVQEPDQHTDQEPVREQIDEDEEEAYEADQEVEPESDWESEADEQLGERRYETYRSFLNEDGDEEIELIQDNDLRPPPMIGSFKPKQWSYTRVYHPPRVISNTPSTSSSEPGCSHWYQSGSESGTSNQPSPSCRPSTSSRTKNNSHRPSQARTSSQPSSSSGPSAFSTTQKTSQSGPSSRVTRSSVSSKVMSNTPSTSSSQPGCSHWYQSGSQPGTTSQPSSSSTFKTPSTSSNTRKTSQRNSRPETSSRITRSSIPPNTRSRRNNADQEDTASINLANVIGLEKEDHSEFLRRRITRSQITNSTKSYQGPNSSSSNVPSVKTVSTAKVENRRTLALQYKLNSTAPHLDQLYREGRNCNMNDYERSRRDRLDYLKLSVEQRKEAFKAGILQIVQHSDQKLFFEERVRLDRLQKSEPTLSKKWFGPSNPKDTAQKRSSLMVSRCLGALQLGYDFIGEYEIADYHRLQDDYPEKLFKSYNPNALYTAPEVRIRITNDITFAKEPKYRVPVYSDIAGETPDNFVVPDSLCFDYANENIVDEKTEILLSEALTESMEEGNEIYCVCDATDPITNCFDNPDCPCFIMNKKLRELQGMSTDPAEFHSFKPLVFNNLQPPFHTHVGFSCSEFCGCYGKCTNNPLFLMKQGVFPMEIYRENEEVGFGIRSTGYIPAGLPVLDFVGEIVDSTRLDHSVLDYCIQLTDIESDAELYALLPKLNDWTPNFKRKLAELREREFHIDCKWQGNISRTLNHSCVPNLECLRIFRRSVTPADMKMVLYTLKNISPGEQLTVDYGDEYWKTNDMKCHCKTVACRMGKLSKKFSKFDFKKMAMCFNVFRVDQANAIGANEAYQNQLFSREDVPDWRREMIVAVDDDEDDDEEDAGMEDQEEENAVVHDGQEDDAVEDAMEDAVEEDDEDVNE